MFGKFINRMFGRGRPGPAAPVGHTLTLTPEMAAEVRQIASDEQLSMHTLSVVVGVDESFSYALDLTEDLAVRTSPDNAVAVSQGLTVVMPRENVEIFEDATINFEDGGFKFRGPHLPEFQSTDPGGMTPHMPTIEAYAPEVAGNPNKLANLKYRLSRGDCSSATVVSLEPFVVAAYAADLDDVALLQLPAEFATGRKLGEAMLTVNVFVSGRDTVPDLVRGPAATDHFCNFEPLIADFFAAEQDLVAQRKRELPAELWDIARARATAALARATGRYRNGLPQHSAKPAY